MMEFWVLLLNKKNVLIIFFKSLPRLIVYLKKQGGLLNNLVIGLVWYAEFANFTKISLIIAHLPKLFCHQLILLPINEQNL